MKPTLKLPSCILVVGMAALTSCKKEKIAPQPIIAQEQTANRPPVAKAGADQIITLPIDKVSLDGSRSTDADNNITSYSWTKILGPTSFNIVNGNAVQTRMTNLVQGVYEFELKVTDVNGLFSEDTVAITVNSDQMNSIHWDRLPSLPSDEFFFGPRYWFDGSNFLMGVDDEAFAVSNHGGVWQYDPSMNEWTKKGAFPENMASIPVVFSLNGNGFCIGNGHCWQYDPATNQWTRKNDPPNDVSCPLVINSKVYMRSGNNQLLAYDPFTDSYTSQNNCPDFQSLSGWFVINGAGYYVGDDGQCWKYDPVTDSWEQKASFNVSGSVFNSRSFSLNNYGYIIGDLGLSSYNDNEPLKLWRYDPSLDYWSQYAPDYPGSGVYDISTVSFNNVVYVGLGYNNGDFNAIDFWSFKE